MDGLAFESARRAPEPGERQYRDQAAAISKAEGADAQAKRMRFVASDESVDRYGDIIRCKGWDLTHYATNPVLLYGHDSGALPIGRVPEIGVRAKRLIATAEFPADGVNEFADGVWRMLQAGFLNAVSVGFMPTKAPNMIWKDDNEASGIVTGFEFIAQELLELSVVPVPANPQALALARDFGISAEAQRALFTVDERASARIAAERRARTITLARLRPGSFGGTST